MKKIGMDRGKWSYRKVAAWSGTLGLTAGIVYIVVKFLIFGVTETL
jgi:hypothetical protein